MKTRLVIPFVSNIDAAFQKAWLQHLRAALPNYQILPFDDLQSPTGIEVAIVANPDPGQIAQLPDLKWVQSLWAGVEKLVQTLPSDITIVRMTDPQLAKTMAEAVLTMTLYLHRSLPRYAAQQSAKLWEQHPVVLPEERIVGVLGLGALGCAACNTLAHHGFSVQGWSRTPKSISGVRCYSGKDGLEEFLDHTDILIVLLPLTNETQGLLNRERLSRMKRGSYVINFARAQIIEIDALLKLLNSGHLSHAVLDVFETEPLPDDDRLWKCGNLTILPHISAPTNMKTASKIAADNILLHFEAGQMPSGVDREQGY